MSELVEKQETPSFKSALKFLFIFCLGATFLLRFSLIDHNLPSNYADDTQLKHKGIYYLEMWYSGLPRQAILQNHIYGLFGYELVTAWTGFQQKFFKNDFPLAREEYARICRQLMMLMGLVFIFGSLGLSPKNKYVLGALAATSFLPYLFSLMTRPHLINLALVTLNIAVGRVLFSSPERWKLLLLGLTSGLAISTLLPSLFTLWFSFLIIKKLRIWSWAPWFLSGLALGLIPGHLDLIILALQQGTERHIMPAQSHIDWLHMFEAHKINFEGVPVFLRVLVSYDPIITLGCLFALFHRSVSPFNKICFFTFLPLICVLGMMSINFPRYWLMAYPFLLIFSAKGWLSFIAKRKRPLLFFSFSLVLCLGLQMRTGWLISHDSRKVAEHQLLQMIPNNAYLLVEPYGARFNNYPAEWRQFTTVYPNSITPEKISEIKSRGHFVFLIATEEKTSVFFQGDYAKHLREIKKWEFPGSPVHTAHLPNSMPWPWISAWRRSVAGPDLYFYRVDIEKIQWKNQ